MSLFRLSPLQPFRRLLIISAVLLQPVALPAEPIPVRFTEGLVHGFLALRTVDGNTLAVGELTQVARGDRVTSHIVFRFKDGSMQEESAVYSQRRYFRLVSDRLVQKGPAFKRSVDLSVNGSTGEVTVHYSEDNGKEQTVTEHLDLPADVSNGLISTMLKDLGPAARTTTVSMVVATPKPRLVKLVISPQGEDLFTVVGSRRKAMRYVVKVEIGGISGVLAPIVGKQPPDTHVWIVGGTAPAFLRSEGPLYQGGPIWRIELISAAWPKESSVTGAGKP